jgi:dolichyl-phosphate-mannose--protein O-mannosyl transferase
LSHGVIVPLTTHFFSLSLSLSLFSLTKSFVAEETAYVTCGSAVKLESVETGYYLNSEEKNLGTGSGQQLITFIKDHDSRNTLWWVRPAHTGNAREYPPEATCQLAEPITCGSAIRLTHLDTMRNLHSHEVKSPLSSQQEVTGFGEGDAKGDAGDDWVVQCSGKHWVRDDDVRLVRDFHISFYLLGRPLDLHC